MTRKTKLWLTAGAAFVVIGTIGNLVKDDDDTTKTEKPPAAAADDTTKEPAEDEPMPFLPGADLDAWTAAVTAHGITWTQEGEEEQPLEGLPDRLRWFGEAVGERFSDPSITASAITTTSHQMMQISCHAAGIPTGTQDAQLAYLTDCAPRVDGADHDELTDWIATTWHASYGRDGIQTTDTTIGPVSLRLLVVADTASLEITPS